MPRSARLIPEEGIFHVITRGNNRMDVFHGDEDYGKYLEILSAVQSSDPFLLYHYCLMTNHVHLLLETKQGHPLSQIMKKLNLTYALYYKKKYRHLGHFWQDRFKSLLIERDIYLLACGAYIELNPVKAGIAKDPAQYPYSSCSFYSQGEAQNLLSPNPLYGEFGDTAVLKQAHYKAFVSSRLEDYDEFEKQIRSKRAFGSEQFLKALENTFKISISRRGRGRPKRGIVQTLVK
jgi:putative transposase